MTDFAEIILALAGAEVEFIIVGGAPRRYTGLRGPHTTSMLSMPARLTT